MIDMWFANQRRLNAIVKIKTIFFHWSIISSKVDEWWRISNGIDADTSPRSVICYRAFCRSTRRADRYAPHNVIGMSQITTTIGVGVELGRVVPTTISARLRDDGIRPVIYPTHSDPQSRARARATPGGFPSCLHSRAPSLSSSFPFADTCSTLDFTDVTLFTLWFTCRNIIPKTRYVQVIKTKTIG